MTDMTAIQTSSEVVDRWLADGTWVDFDVKVFDLWGTRLAVQVPCRACVKVMRTYSFVVHRDGLITVAWATVEWGPSPVGWDDIIGLHIDLSGVHRILPEPPDVDPQTLIGQWARGGSIEATA